VSPSSPRSRGPGDIGWVVVIEQRTSTVPFARSLTTCHPMVPVKRLLAELVPPCLFAAEGFLREIQALAARFEVLRVDVDNFRHRAVVTDAAALPDEVVVAAARKVDGSTLDGFADLLAHLATVRPSRCGALLDDVALVALTGVGTIHGQDVALRFGVLVDRPYDRDVPVLLARRSGTDQGCCASRRAISAATSKSAGGQARSRPFMARVRSSVTANRAYHLRSAGTAYHGATSVEVRSKTAW
jgi:hypothetical protein